MKMYAVNITIGIPTYNEEDNIVSFFENLVQQISQLDYIFEIIVVDDSEDNTLLLMDEIRLAYPNIYIQVIHNNKRLGATHAWNTIFQMAKGEIIVLLDADIRLGEKCIENLINSITGEVGLCASNTLPITKVNTKYSRASAFIAYWLRSIRQHGLSQYTTMGRALALEAKVGRNFRIPNEVIAIDLYLQCLVIQEGKAVTFNDKAIIYFTPPSTKRDFYSQIVRAIKGHAQISQFTSKFKFNAPLKFTLKEFVRTGFEHPRGALNLISCYILLPIYYIKNSKEVTYLWESANSTKRL